MVMSRRPGNTGKPRGVPHREIDWSKVDQMIIEGCNGVQVAAGIGICSDTLYTACIREKGVNFSAYFQEKRSLGNNYLHRTQFHKAVKDKNVQMLIHLGKHRLDQKDREDEIEKPSRDEVVKHENENMILKAQLALLNKKIDELQAKVDNESKTRSELSGSDTSL